MKSKICGVTTEADASLCESLGADFIGLNFADISPRVIDVNRAKSIASTLTNAKSIGIFVEQSTEEIEHIAKEVGLWGVQFYSDLEREMPGFVTIKALRVRDPRTIGVMAVGRCDYYLLDAYSDSAMGGTGKTFDWSLLPPNLDRVFLAGGIKAENIRFAMDTRPFAIDVCSGVESSPGVKDERKLRRLFEEIRA